MSTKIKLKLKKKVKVETSDFWYDLTDGGYIKPEDFSSDPESVQKIKDAVELIRGLQDLCELY